MSVQPLQKVRVPAPPWRALFFFIFRWAEFVFLLSEVYFENECALDGPMWLHVVRLGCVNWLV